MADDYDYDVDDGDGYGDDWLYVEDDFPLADELAETQIADPGYAGTNHEVEMESWDYEFYGYWDDLEYADDAYWDYEDQRPSDAGGKTQAGQKRKRGVPAKAAMTDKRRKISATAAANGGAEPAGGMPDNVIFRTSAERRKLFMRRAPVLEKKNSIFAFLPDWKERFAHLDGLIKIDSMPVEMERAAFAADEAEEDLPLAAQGEEDDWEDEDAAEEALPGHLAALDPDMLKVILKRKMGEAGLEGMDEGAFMATLSRMLAGDEDAAAGELANTLLSNATEGGDEALSGWLSQQGVSLDADVQDDGDGTELPEGSAMHVRRGMHVSPPDSAISLPKESSQITELALHPSSPQERLMATTRAQKRKQTKRVTFDVPTSSAPEGEQLTLEQNEEDFAERSTATEDHNSTAVNTNTAISDASSDAPVPASGETHETKATKATINEQTTKKRKAEEDAATPLTRSGSVKQRSRKEARRAVGKVGK